MGHEEETQETLGMIPSTPANRDVRVHDAANGYDPSICFDEVKPYTYTDDEGNFDDAAYQADLNACLDSEVNADLAPFM